MGTNCTDIQLLREMAEGSVEAFDKLYIRYFSLVESFAFALLKNRQDAEDLCQTVFMKLWRKREVLGEIDSVSGYLFIMTRNEIYKLFSKRKHIAYIDNMPLTLLHELSATDVEKKVSDRDIIHLINLALDTMPEQRRTIFYLSRKEGKTYSEIAAQLGVSEKTVEYHISKALQELRRLLKIIILFF